MSHGAGGPGLRQGVRYIVGVGMRRVVGSVAIDGVLSAALLLSLLVVPADSAGDALGSAASGPVSLDGGALAASAVSDPDGPWVTASEGMAAAAGLSGDGSVDAPLDGALSDHLVLDAAGSPWVVDVLGVPYGVTLTLLPGTVLKFKDSVSRISAYGGRTPMSPAEIAAFLRRAGG